MVPPPAPPAEVEMDALVQAPYNSYSQAEGAGIRHTEGEVLLSMAAGSGGSTKCVVGRWRGRGSNEECQGQGGSG